MKLRLCEKKPSPAITEDQQTAITNLGEDFKTLLGASNYPDLGSLSAAMRINMWSLHKIRKGILTGPSVTVGTIHLIAEKLGGEVKITAPSEEWDHKTPLCALWKMGAKIRLIARST
ncbi:MAG TPA: hypothetical protein VIJ29_04745 [Candidatus Paceibacterota bacterium]